MNLPECKLLEDYCDDDLVVELKTQFENHLPTCANCRERLVQLRDLDALIVKAWNNVELPDETVVHRSEQSSLAPQSTRPAMAMWVIASLAATLLLTLGVSRFAGKTAPELAESNKPQPADVAINGTENLISTIEEILNRETNHTDSAKGVAANSYQTSYATVSFDSATHGSKIETNKEFTVYRVTPTVTYSKTN